MSSKRPTTLYSNFQKPKIERILKAAREKRLITYKESSIRLSVDFFHEKLCRTESSGLIYFIGSKKNKLLSRILYPA